MRIAYIFILILFIANCKGDNYQEYEDWLISIPQSSRAVKFLRLHDKYIERISSSDRGKEIYCWFNNLSYEHQVESVEDLWLYKTHDDLNDLCWCIYIVVPIISLSYIIYRSTVIYDNNNPQSGVKFSCCICKFSLYFE